MPKKPLIIIPLLAIAAGAAAFTYFHTRPKTNPGELHVSGNIEVTDAQVSFKIAGLVDRRPVDEGEMVKAGDLVAQLDTSDLTEDVALRDAELAAAKSALDELLAGSRPEEIGQAQAAANAAKAKLDELLAGSRPQEIAASEATLAAAQADANRARIDYERLEKLRQSDTATGQEYDLAKAAYDMGRARVQQTSENLKLIKEGPRKEVIDQARAALAEANQHLALVKNGPRKETIDQARARVGQAEAALRLAKTQLGYATLNSPMTGVVLSKNIEPGEYVAPGTPVVTVGDLVHLWLRAYVNETDLGRVRVGQTARVTTDTYPGKVYTGRLSFISSQAEFTPKNVETEKERVKLVFRIKIDIENTNMELKPGMPADAEIVLQ